MKKLLTIFTLYSLLFILCGNAHAVTSWWLQPTICRPNPTNCYAGMGTGFDSGMWDATANCWGLKMICPAATTAADSSPVAIGKTTIASGTGINADFDINVLNGDCFGARKAAENGTMALVNGSFVKVWCNNVLSNPDEQLSNGEIKFGTQPVCRDLAPSGYAAIVNNRCYGKYYDPANYYIECTGNNTAPTRLVVLNGADRIVGLTAGTYNYPTDTNAAKSLFDTMQSVSSAKRSQYFQ